MNSNSTYFGDGFPYSDVHNLNLDWIIQVCKQMQVLIGQVSDGLEIHVKDDSGAEVYVFTVKSNGIYVTRPDGGTPVYYNLATGQLHAPTFDGQSILTATARTTGQHRAGSLVLDTPLPLTGGGTGATTASGARTALGAEPAFNVLGIPKGGTGATTASDALTALGGVPTTRTVNSKPLSSNVTLTADDVDALPDTAVSLSSGTNLNSLAGGMYASSTVVQPSLVNSPWALNLITIYCVISNAGGSSIVQYAFAGQRSATRYYDGSNWSRWTLSRYLYSDSTSGTIPGAIPGIGSWMVTVTDEDPTHLYMGVLQRTSTTTSQLSSLASSSITFSGGNAVGTVIFGGTTGSITCKAEQLTF